MSEPSYTVLGASGFIGGSLAAVLRTQGGDVRCPRRDELRTLTGELGHVFYALGIDNVVEDPFGAIDAHVAHLRHVLRNCSFTSLTYFSSTRLYLNAKSGGEDAPVMIDLADPGRLYNATKLAGEMLCLAIDRPEVKVVRISNVVGYAPRGINLIPMLIKNALSKREMHLSIEPSSEKDYIALDDVLDTLPRIARSGRHRLYNLGFGANLSVGEIVACLEQCTGAKAVWARTGQSTKFPRLEMGRVVDEFAFKPRPVMPMLPDLCRQFAAGSQDAGVCR